MDEPSAAPVPHPVPANEPSEPAKELREGAEPATALSGQPLAAEAGGAGSGVGGKPASDAEVGDKAAHVGSGSGSAGAGGKSAPAGNWAGRPAVWCWLAALLSGGLHLVAFPPFDAAAAAYIFALPLLLLCVGKSVPRARTFALASFCGFWLSWVLILWWLRHISPPWGVVGAVVLGAVLAVFPLLWFVAARRVVPLLAGLGLARRVVLLFALAGWWVVLEWVRGWLFTGFPWLPLSASQWQLPVMLQPAAWTGHYGVSFILIYFNLAILQYLRNWLVRFNTNPLEAELAEASATTASSAKAGRGASVAEGGVATTGGVVGESREVVEGEANGASEINSASGANGAGDEAEYRPRAGEASSAERWRRDSHFSGRPSMGGGSFGGGDFAGGSIGSRVRVKVCPEFYIGLLFLMGSILLYQQSLQQMRERVPMFSAAVVQPWIPATIKWEAGQARNTLDVLYDLTLEAAALSPQPDVIIWPETATPFSLVSDESQWMRNWTDSLVRYTRVPLLTGALAREDGALLNGLFYVDVQDGVQDTFYAKRRLVPFGEYAPLRSLLPFMGKVVPLKTDISAGTEPMVLPVQIAGRPWQIGTLICYEDIFGQLGRASVLEGADLLLVITNDAWYGEDAGGYQHAAHSVLRAVETRRPLLRAGNHGWSGWIDEAGVVRGVFADESGNIYQRGVETFDLARSLYWTGRPSFYVSRGDWFVGLCGAFALWGALSLVLSRHRRSV